MKLQKKGFQDVVVYIFQKTESDDESLTTYNEHIFTFETYLLFKLNEVNILFLLTFFALKILLNERVGIFVS